MRIREVIAGDCANGFECMTVFGNWAFHFFGTDRLQPDG